MVGAKDSDEEGECREGEKVIVNLSRNCLCIHTTNPRTFGMETKLFRNSFLMRSWQHCGTHLAHKTPDQELVSSNAGNTLRLSQPRMSSPFHLSPNGQPIGPPYLINTSFTNLFIPLCAKGKTQGYKYCSSYCWCSSHPIISSPPRRTWVAFTYMHQYMLMAS